MDYDFYAVPSGSGLDIEEPTRPDASWKEDATGTQTVTYTVSDLTGYWSGLGYAVPDPAPTASYEYTIAAAPVLETLTASGSLTNVQIVGTTPDLTGLTFTAGYSDGSSTTVSSTAITVSPATYDASGNPMNLREVDLTLGYTDGDVTATTGVDNVVTHRPNEQSIEFKSGTPSHVYFDYDPDWASIKGPAQIFSEMGGSGTGVGDRLILFFNDAAYQNDTAVDYATFGGWVGAYDMVTTPSGTINTAGYVPAVGTLGPQSDSTQSYVAVSVNGSTSATGTADTLHIVIGTAVNALSGSYKLSDLDSTGRTHYICHMIAD